MSENERRDVDKQRIATIAATKPKTLSLRRECSPMTRHHQPHIDRCFDIDEPTSETSPESNAQQVPLEYGKRVDAHRLAAVSQNGGWWNPTTQELIPILPEDHPDYPQNQEIIREATRRWDRGTSK